MLISPLCLSATWINGNVVVNNIIWKPNYKGFYAKQGTFHNPDNCTDTSRLYVIDDSVSDAEMDRLLSILLTAQTTGKRINVWVDGCRGAYAKFTGVQINN